jgi:hypothetical protein
LAAYLKEWRAATGGFHSLEDVEIFDTCLADEYCWQLSDHLEDLHDRV